jgi:NAD-dependent dihydropyrimidine dehydrogenase PreA subunit
VLRLGVQFKGGVRIESMQQLLAENWDAVFVGSGAPRGRDLSVPGRTEAAAQIHIGIDWLASCPSGIHAHRQARDRAGRRQHAMDCCRTSKRLGGDDVKVIVRSPFDEMKASPWEKEDAMHEGIPILECLVPKEFLHTDGKLTGMRFEKVKAVRDERGRRQLLPTGEPDRSSSATRCWSRWARRTPSRGSSATSGIEFDEHGMPRLDPLTLQSTRPDVFFGGDAALGPKNIIWAVAQGHAAAISIDKFLHGEPVTDRPPPGVTLVSQKMGIHEWSYDNEVAPDTRHKVPWRDVNQVLRNIKVEVELGFDVKTAWKEAQRCLNCDVQTVFSTSSASSATPCVDICPVDCITFTRNGAEPDLRTRLRAPARHADQALYVSDALKTTGNVMVKDEDVCLHCGLCAERCPTGRGTCRSSRSTSRAQAKPAGRSANARWHDDADASRQEAHHGGQRLRRQVRQRQRLGVGVGQRDVRAQPAAHGRAGEPAQHLPVQHPGPAHLVRGARERARLAGPARRRGPDGGDEPADLGQGPRRDRARRLPAVRQQQAAAAVEVPRRRQRDRRAADRDVRHALHRPRERQLLKNIVYVGVLRR